MFNQILVYKCQLYLLADLDEQNKKSPMSKEEYRKAAAAILNVPERSLVGKDPFSLMVI